MIIILFIILFSLDLLSITYLQIKETTIAQARLVENYLPIEHSSDAIATMYSAVAVAMSVHPYGIIAANGEIVGYRRLRQIRSETDK